MDIRQDTLMGLHAIYPERVYRVRDLGDYLVLFHETWRRCVGLTVYRYMGHTQFGLVNPIEQGQIEQAAAASLLITRLRIESPMDLAVIAQGGGYVGIVAYSIHLFVRVLRDPERIGSWLPRLVASWELGWKEAAKAKKARHNAEREEAAAKRFQGVAVLVEIADQLTSTGLKPDEVTALGAGDPQDELVEMD